MRFTVQFRAVYAILVFFLTACTLALANPEIHATLSLDKLSQDDHSSQKPIAVLDAGLPNAFPAHQPMQAASDAVSAERPIGKMVVAVVVSGVLFGLGMGI
ncbi:uncharacterized protein EKO05_0008663 [Ascochyta rabiei]|uniref:Uncharacterized protein n=1 Tax=Didymella rabiei TaxID=5454 RepID=A0A163FWC0_DIDRA|nr:uncharacterized protein EKO05_0008663 [Ascochyta rabiei]KZM24567.1 hypothetical protein ST47_g4263 [Ascochyta rabiei]UPX18361.1 hypothetical protein EKO05_0008663 [Ascochyta rabiei]